MGLSYAANAWANVAGPGAWTDPGYLAVGMGLSVAGSRSQMAIWGIMKAILLVDADLSKLDGLPTNASNPFLAVLKNEELIQIHHDPLGFIGRLVNSSCGELQTAGPCAHPRRRRAPRRRPAGDSEDDLSGVPSFQGVSACQLDPATATPEQKWTIRWQQILLQSGGSRRLSAASSEVNGTVLMAACDESSAGQCWLTATTVAQGGQPPIVADISLTVAPMVLANSSVVVDGSTVALCLATNGSSLFLEPCAADPAACNRSRCEFSDRLRQLWYRTATTGQLLSTYTNHTIPQVQRGLSAGPEAPPPALMHVPICLATAPNRHQPQPPTPPKYVPDLPLKVWGAKLSGGRTAILLQNAHNNLTHAPSKVRSQASSSSFL